MPGLLGLFSAAAAKRQPTSLLAYEGGACFLRSQDSSLAGVFRFCQGALFSQLDSSRFSRWKF